LLKFGLGFGLFRSLEVCYNFCPQNVSEIFNSSGNRLTFMTLHRCRNVEVKGRVIG